MLMSSIVAMQFRGEYAAESVSLRVEAAAMWSNAAADTLPKHLAGVSVVAVGLMQGCAVWEHQLCGASYPKDLTGCSCFP